MKKSYAVSAEGGTCHFLPKTTSGYVLTCRPWLCIFLKPLKSIWVDYEGLDLQMSVAANKKGYLPYKPQFSCDAEDMRI